MSVSIHDAVNVAVEVWNKHASGFGGSIRQDRRGAVANRAFQRGVHISTVQSSCTHALAPDVWGIEEFDDLLDDWINNGNTQIKFVLQSHAKDAQDHHVIRLMP